MHVFEGNMKALIHYSHKALRTVRFRASCTMFSIVTHHHFRQMYLLYIRRVAQPSQICMHLYVFLIRNGIPLLLARCVVCVTDVKRIETVLAERVLQRSICVVCVCVLVR